MGRAGLYGGAPFPFRRGRERPFLRRGLFALFFHILRKMVADTLAVLEKSQLLGRAPHKEGLGCG